MKENFHFETAQNSVVFSELIVSRMISPFGISRDEAMGATYIFPYSISFEE